MWTAAFGQAFFSLSVGTGIMLTYGSYMGEEKIIKSAAIITISDLMVAILAGLIIFPIVFTFGFDPAAGVQLAFGTIGIILAGLILSIIVGWFLDPDIIFHHIGGERWMQMLFYHIIKFMIPIILFVNLVIRIAGVMGIRFSD